MPQDTVRTLARLGPTAMPRLVEMLLTHPRPEARQLAAHALGQMGPAADPAVSALARAMSDVSRNVRLTAADALAHVGPTAGRSAPALTRAFREEPPVTSDQRGLEGSPSARIAIIRALAAVGEPGRKALAGVVVPTLIDDMRNDRTERVTTGVQLAACGPAGAPCLPHVLDHIRRRPDAVLGDQWFVAVLDLGPGGVDVYRQLLTDTNPQIRQHALRAFYYLKLDVTIFAPEIADCMRNPDPKVRWAAADQVSKFPDSPPELVAATVGLLGDRGVLADYPPTSGMDAPGGGPVTRALVYAGRRAVPGATAALAHPDAVTRMHAALALGEIGPAAAAALPALRRLAADQLYGPAIAGFQAQYKITADAAALAGLAALAGDAPVEGRRLAAEGLARFGPAAAAHEDVFLPLLDDDDPAVRAAAVKAVCELGPGAKVAAARLAAGIRRPTDLGRSIPTPLTKLGPALAPAVPALRSFLRENPGQLFVEYQVLQAIGPAARAAVPEILELALRDDFRAADALETLAAVRPRPAVAVRAGRAGLLNRSEFARVYALRLLGVTGREAREALPQVKEALADPDPEVRVWAIYAATRIEGSVTPYLPQLTRELAPDRQRVRGTDAGARFAERVIPLLAPEAPEVVPVVLDLLRRGDDGFGLGGRAAAFRAVAGYGAAAKGVVPLVVAELARPAGQLDYREELCEAMGAVGPAAIDALPVLRELAAGSKWNVVWAARRAIGRIEVKELLGPIVPTGS
jgi:HEAT repeat protein